MKPSENEHYIGERLSLKGQSCTVRYAGQVAEKPGIWLGVEWDDSNRGKHNGTHDGKVYFACRSTSPTPASFLRPNRSWDTPRTFLQAVQEKYMPAFHKDEAEIVYISGKQAEEVGFEKFSQRQARLQGIHVLVLDHMRIQHRAITDDETSSIKRLCVDITELDLTGNLFETFDEIVQLCKLLPKLRVLTLDENRFFVKPDQVNHQLSLVSSISLSRTFLEQLEVNKIVSALPILRTLTFAGNEMAEFTSLQINPGLNTLDLSDNHLSSIFDLGALGGHCPHTVNLKRNRISAVGVDQPPPLSLPVVELDLTYNAIDNWSFFNDITKTTFPELKHLRITGNPLYKDLVSAEGRPLSTEDGYMLTIARLPQLDYINYAKITEKERLNAETYYLNQIAAELSKVPEGRESVVLSRHPRYQDLCKEYGEPTIQRTHNRNDINPNSLAAKLVAIDFFLAPTMLPDAVERTWSEAVPKSFSVYTLLGLIGKRLNIMPLDLHLVLETSERDPVGGDGGYSGPEWWDSSDDEADGEAEEWVSREVELVAGTRAIGTYVEGRVARVKIEMRLDES